MHKKAGIYDRWLHVLGGGERHTVAFARALVKLGYQVDLITHRPVSLNQLKNKFGLDEINFNIKYIPEMWDWQITPHTKEYDLFILNSFADIFTSKAKKSILSVFFPVALKPNPKEYITRAIIVPAFRKLFQFPLYVQVEQNIITIGTNKPSSKIVVRIEFDQLALSVIEQIVAMSDEAKIKCEVNVLHKTNEAEIKLTANKSIRQWQITLPKSDFAKNFMVKINQNWWDDFGAWISNLGKGWKERFQAGPRVFTRSELDSYDLILPISAFTKYWVEKYWGKSGPVVFPPASVEEFKPNKHKKNIIISTGRFFVGGHNKKQLELVEAFKKIHKILPDWEFHLVGSVNDAPIHRQYFEQVKLASRGYPIIIHENSSFEEMAEILGKAKIYWHAAGLGIDENRFPVMLEHFGLTVVEAMAAGCVPVVINRGGPMEVVPDASLVWDNIDQLIKITTMLANDEQRMRALSDLSIQCAKKYTQHEFENSVAKLL